MEEFKLEFHVDLGKIHPTGGNTFLYTLIDYLKVPESYIVTAASSSARIYVKELNLESGYSGPLVIEVTCCDKIPHATTFAVFVKFKRSFTVVSMANSQPLHACL